MPRDTATATKEALLDAAREEFAAYGMAGARVDRIARRAGVNKERIYGYFGSKDKLFDAVMQVALNELAEAVSPPGEDPVEYAGQMFDYHRAHPDLLRLLMWEALHERREALPHSRWRLDRCQGKLRSLAAGLGREPSPEVALLMFTLIGLAGWPHAMPQIAEVLLGQKVGAPQGADAMRAQITAFARAALTGPAAQ